MKKENKTSKIDSLNALIKKNLRINSSDELIEMILLSARATLYLRNNDKRKFKNIEPAIDDILNIYKRKKTI